jgi:hypothetical protein
MIKSGKFILLTFSRLLSQRVAMSKLTGTALLLLAGGLLASSGWAEAETTREELNRIAAEKIMAGATVYDTRYSSNVLFWGASWFGYRRRKQSLKGLSHATFWLVFLACMDATRPECELLLVFFYILMMLI